MLNFILNPTAGNGKSLKFKQIISEELQKRGIPHVFHLTNGKHHATQITKKLTESGEKEIVVMGGDGTLHEVLNGISDTSEVTLGLIPCGSGNDFASSVNIPGEAEKSLEIVLNGNIKYIDYMECSGIRGINIIGAGIDCEILKRCYKSKVLKGKAKYLISTVISVLDFKCRNLASKTDNSVFDNKAFVVCASNGQNFGGGIPIAPEAIVDDGLLDFVVVKEMNILRRFKTMVGLMKGKILQDSKTVFERTQRILISTETPIDVEIDGEIYPNTVFDVSVVHNKLKMFTL